MTMQYRQLGKSPLKVSALCLGTMMFADQTDRAEAKNIVAHAHEHGVNFIDTADVYSTGKSESMVGDLLDGARHDWVLATKVGNKMSERPNESQYSRTWVQRACDASLQRLGTDHIDLYYLHRDFNGMDLEEPLRAHRRIAACGQDPQLGRVELPRLAHRRGGAHGAPDQHARAGGLPALLQPAQPPTGSGGAAGLPAPRHWRCALQPDRPRRARRQVRAGRQAGRRHARRARRQTHAGKRIPRRVAGHCANPEGALRPEGRVAGPLRHRVGASAQGRHGRDRRAANLGAVAGLLRRARLRRSAPKTRPWSIRWSNPATPRRPATTTRPTRSKGAE